MCSEVKGQWATVQGGEKPLFFLGCGGSGWVHTGEEAKGLACLAAAWGAGGVGGWKAIGNELAGLPVWGSGTWAGRMRQGLFYVS